MRDPVIHYREQAARKKLPPTNRSSLSCPFSPLLQIFIPPPHGPAVNGREKRSFPPPTIGAPSPTEEQACVLQSTIGGCFHRSSPSHLAPFNNFGETAVGQVDTPSMHCIQIRRSIKMMCRK